MHPRLHSCAMLKRVKLLITSKDYQNYRAHILFVVLKDLLKYTRCIDLKDLKDKDLKDIDDKSVVANTTNKLTAEEKVNIANLHKSKFAMKLSSLKNKKSNKLPKPWRIAAVTLESLYGANQFMDIKDILPIDIEHYHKFICLDYLLTSYPFWVCGVFLKINGLIGYLFDLFYSHLILRSSKVITKDVKDVKEDKSKILISLVQLGKIMYQDNFIFIDHRLDDAITKHDCQLVELLYRCGANFKNPCAPIKTKSDLPQLENKSSTTNNKSNNDDKHKSIKLKTNACLSRNYGVVLREKSIINIILELKSNH